MRARRLLPRILAALVLGGAMGCSDDAAPPTGRWRAQDPAGGSVALVFVGESDVRMELADAAGAPVFARMCSFTVDGDTITVRDGAVAKTMELELDGDTLTGDELVFERE